MNPPKPHFLLFCEGTPISLEAGGAQNGRGKSQAPKNARWRFVLENVSTGEKFEANDLELGCTQDRASLISVLRGLEALEQPSKVTLVTNNRYVFRGLRYGLSEWRENDFAWEHFGAVQPIRNADVWRRIDRTLSYHEVQCRWMAMGENQRNNPSDSGEIQWSVAAAAARVEQTQSMAIAASTAHAATIHTATTQTATPHLLQSDFENRKESEFADVHHGSTALCHERHNDAHSKPQTGIFKDSNSSFSTSSTELPTAKKLAQSIENSFQDLETAIDSDAASREVTSQSEMIQTATYNTYVVRPEARVCKGDSVAQPLDSVASPLHSPEESQQTDAPIPTTATLPRQTEQNSDPSKSLTKSESLTAESTPGHSPRSVLFYPFAICWSICKRILLAVWEAILRLDEGVESYLRCMLLLDPKQYRRRK